MRTFTLCVYRFEGDGLMKRWMETHYVASYRGADEAEALRFFRELHTGRWPLFYDLVEDRGDSAPSRRWRALGDWRRFREEIVSVEEAQRIFDDLMEELRA